MDTQYVLIFYSCILAAVSVIAFFAYGKDKRIAKRGGERIKEKHLLSLAAFGGAAGAFAARLVFRHKTDKPYFSAVIYVSLVLHIAVEALLVMALKGVLK